MNTPQILIPPAYRDLREPKKPMATRMGFVRRVIRRFRKRGLLGA